MHDHIIYFNNNEYSFSLKAILLFLIGGPFFSILIYTFLNLDVNNWLKEITAKQTSFLLKYILNLDSQAVYNPTENYPWSIYIPSIDMNFYISTWCTGAHLASFIIGTIILVPPSKKGRTRNEILWRKVIFLIGLISFIYIGNIVRLIFILYSANISTNNWGTIHYILNYTSGIIAAFVFIFALYKILPEFYISIYYLRYFIPIKKKKG